MGMAIKYYYNMYSSMAKYNIFRILMVPFHVDIEGIYANTPTTYRGISGTYYNCIRLHHKSRKI